MNKKLSIKERVLIYLKEGRSITHLHAWGEFGTHRLAAYIKRLRNDGYSIRTVMRRSATGRPYAEYYLV